MNNRNVELKLESSSLYIFRVVLTFDKSSMASAKDTNFDFSKIKSKEYLDFLQYSTSNKKHNYILLQAKLAFLVCFISFHIPLDIDKNLYLPIIT